MSARKPISELELAGSPNIKRALNYDAPKAGRKKQRAGRPAMPDFLNDAERVAWRELCDLLESRCVLTRGDLDAMVLFAQTKVTYRAEKALLDREGRVAVRSSLTKSGHEILRHEVNPRCAVVAQLEKTMIKLLIEFGLTPKHRRVEDAESGEEPVNEGKLILEESRRLFAKAN